MPANHSDLPQSFRRIELVLAREPGHPEGDPRHRFTVLAPLDAKGRLDKDVWADNRAACRVVRYRTDRQDDVGHIVRGHGGHWGFHYDIAGEAGDEGVRRLDDVELIPGAYVSLREEDGEHTLKVVSVSEV